MFVLVLRQGAHGLELCIPPILWCFVHHFSYPSVQKYDKNLRVHLGSWSEGGDLLW